MSSRVLRSFVVLTLPLAAIALTPMVASAGAPTVTITIGATGKLLDPTLVRVPVEITCAPLIVGFPPGGNADLRQAASGRIAFGIGAAESAVTCDGTAHPNSYLVWVSTSSPAPFRRGNATVDVSATLCDAAFVCETGDSGIRVIRLKQ